MHEQAYLAPQSTCNKSHSSRLKALLQHGCNLGGMGCLRRKSVLWVGIALATLTKGQVHLYI